MTIPTSPAFAFWASSTGWKCLRWLRSPWWRHCARPVADPAHRRLCASHLVEDVPGDGGNAVAGNLQPRPICTQALGASVANELSLGSGGAGRGRRSARLLRNRHGATRGALATLARTPDCRLLLADWR